MLQDISLQLPDAVWAKFKTTSRVRICVAEWSDSSNRRKYPEYYEQVKMPISLDMIQVDHPLLAITCALSNRFGGCHEDLSKYSLDNSHTMASVTALSCFWWTSTYHSICYTLIRLCNVRPSWRIYGYATMEKLESDLKRLVQNAKEFNSTKSEVYEDAERIRKALSNFHAQT